MAIRPQPMPRDVRVPRMGEPVPRRSDEPVPANAVNGRRLGQSAGSAASLVSHPFRLRSARATVETRWYPQSPISRAPGLPIVDLAAPSAGRKANGQESAASTDRVCAIVTMIVAATLAVAVSIIVAPR